MHCKMRTCPTFCKQGYCRVDQVKDSFLRGEVFNSRYCVKSLQSLVLELSKFSKILLMTSKSIPRHNFGKGKLEILDASLLSLEVLGSFNEVRLENLPFLLRNTLAIPLRTYTSKHLK